MNSNNPGNGLIWAITYIINDIQSRFSIPRTILLYTLVMSLSLSFAGLLARFGLELSWVAITATILGVHEYLSYQCEMTLKALAHTFPDHLGWVNNIWLQQVLIVTTNLLFAYPMFPYEKSLQYTLFAIVFLLIAAFLWMAVAYIEVYANIMVDQISDVPHFLLHRDPHRSITVIVLISFSAMYIFIPLLYSRLTLTPFYGSTLHPGAFISSFLFLTIALCIPTLSLPLTATVLLFYIFPEFVWLHQLMARDFLPVADVLIGLYSCAIAYWFYNGTFGLLTNDVPSMMRVAVVVSWLSIGSLILAYSISNIVDKLFS